MPTYDCGKSYSIFIYISYFLLAAIEWVLINLVVNYFAGVLRYRMLRGQVFCPSFILPLNERFNVTG